MGARRSAEANDAKTLSHTLWVTQQSRTKPHQLRAVCGILQGGVYHNQIKDVEEPRQRVEEELDGLDQRVIDTASREWRRRLRACIAADEGYFEHALL